MQRILFGLGYDKYEETSLIAIVHSVSSVPPTKKLKVALRCGTASKNTYESRETTNCEWEEPMNIVIEQGSPMVEIHLMSGRQMVAKAEIPVEEIWEYQNASEPKTKINLRKTVASGFQLNPTLALTWAFPENDNLPLLLGYGIATPEGVQKKELGLPELSEYCNGWLEKAYKLGLSHRRYFEMFKHNGQWYWGWTEGRDAKTSEKLDKSVDASRITSVSPIPEDKHGFIVKYVNDNREKKTIVLKCNEGKSRDAWVEGLRLFFSRYRSLQKQRRDSSRRESNKTLRESPNGNIVGP